MSTKPETKSVKKDIADHLAKVQPLRPGAIDADTAAAYVSLSLSTIESLERAGEFPRRRQLSGRRVGFLVRELDEWLESRPVSDQLPPVGCEFGRAGKPGKAALPTSNS